MIRRAASEHILKCAKQFPAVLIQGPRQSGKTTLAKSLFPEKAYYSFEYPDIRKLFETDPRAFLSEIGSEGAILDEVQNVPEILSYLQGMIDEEGQNGKYILTGSSNFKIMSSVSQSLAGRCAICKLLPLSLTEHHSEGLDNQIISGGYPRIYSSDVDLSEYYRSYIETYVEKDIRRTLNIKDFKAFEGFVVSLAVRIGSMVEFSSISNDCGISVNTIKEWLSILEQSYIVFLLPAWYESRTKRLVKSKKIYFYDTGLACSILGLTESEQLKRERLRGALFENLVILEKLKQAFNFGLPSSFYYYRTSNGVEVDLIEENGGRLNGYEVKASTTFDPDFLKGLVSFRNDYDDEADEMSVIYAGDYEGRAKGCRIVNYMNMV